MSSLAELRPRCASDCFLRSQFTKLLESVGTAEVQRLFQAGVPRALGKAVCEATDKNLRAQLLYVANMFPSLLVFVVAYGRRPNAEWH